VTLKWPQATTKLVEDKANGTAVIATLKHEISGLIQVNPEGGKEARAAAVSPQIESGNIYLPHPLIASWVTGYLAEWASFPRGAHDDQVDASTQALNRMRQDDRPNFLIYMEDEVKRLNPAAWEKIQKERLKEL
jgi:predicted phage terminase large subunit-like protein